MPRYDYVCVCGFNEERTHSIFDETVQICSDCSEPLTKKYGSVGISFVGPHFYSNSDEFVRYT
jgi:predicted nucleic acid-binding Zn ribbon protein